MNITTKGLIEQISKLNLDVKFESIEIKLVNGKFIVLKVIFDKNSYLKGITQAYLKSNHTNNANQNGENRKRSKKFDKQIEGVLGEIAVLEYLKKFITVESKGGCALKLERHDDTRTDEFKSSKNEFDIKIINSNNKEFIIEARASLNYKTIFDENTLKTFDTIGKYKNPIKQFESDSDFYIRPLFQLKNPNKELNIKNISLLNMLLDNEVDLYLTGGVSFDLINEKGYDTDFNQKNAKYKAIKIIDGLDMVQLTNLIRKTVCSNND